MEHLVNILTCVALVMVIAATAVAFVVMIASERRWARYEKTREEIFAKLLRELEELEDAAVDAEEE